MDRKERLVEHAVETYFSLYIRDWAERHQLSPELLHELQHLMTDFYHFAEGMVEAGGIAEEDVQESRLPEKEAAAG
ncbi:MAG: hypothetical protein D6715_08535 [Calditrichaeota bacterium]|nr:MAG: hypothetical protein D6715_08535 [Calditrichota bacterium]